MKDAIPEMSDCAEAILDFLREKYPNDPGWVLIGGLGKALAFVLAGESGDKAHFVRGVELAKGLVGATADRIYTDMHRGKPS